MAFVKKLALGSIFISILCIFAMSHNVSAIDFTYNLNNYELVKTYPSGTNYCNITGGMNIDQGRISTCSFIVSGTTTIKSITFKPNFDIKKGDLLEFYIYLFVNTPNLYSPTLNNIGIGSNFSTLNFELVMDDNLYNEFLSQGGYINWSPNNDLDPGNYLQARQNFYIYKVSQIALKDLTAPDIGLDISSSSTGIFQFDAEAFGVSVYARIRNLNVYRFAGSEENKEVEEKTQEAVDESQAAGSGSSSSASQGGANLLTAITGFFNVITSAQPTNCRFNAPLNTYFGNQNLNVDLCALDLPQGIGALTSIIAIGILIPFAIHMFNKFIALFRSFQS